MQSAVTRLRLCGAPAIELAGDGAVEDRLPGRQGALVVAYLALNRARPVARGELAELLWPADAPADPAETLAVLLSKLRRALGPDVLVGRQELRLAFAPEPEVDWEVAVARAERAASALADGDARTAWEQASSSVDIAAGGFLTGHAGPWVDERRRDLEELLQGALETLVAAGIAMGGAELAAAERAARTLVEIAPFRESAHRLLMEALARGGNAAEALRVYEHLRVLLREELGAVPAPEVQDLHARLLAGERAAPLPSLLAPRDRSAFVGREHELEALRAAWREACAGSRRLVLVVGEPGIGKTRLTSELAQEALEGGTVRYAACQEDALLSYQPFVEALRDAGGSSGFDWAGAALGAADPETRRYLLFEAVSSFLTDASAAAPLLLVLDDLHWADAGTIDLLRHVVRAPREAPLLIVGTYREAEVAAGHPLAELLADLRRERRFERVSLAGLDADGVAALVATHAGERAPARLAGTVHEQTAGNPFFVEEVMRHLAETGALEGRPSPTAEEIGVPEGVKEVLGRRLRRLSDACRTALAEAAVLGRSFTYDVLRAMSEADDDVLIPAVEEAVAAQLVVEAPGAAYDFAHALVRETLYEGLSGPRRQRMHARAAAAIEAVEGEEPLAALAVHHRLAGSAGDADRAVAFSLRAGAQARELSAWDEAAAHWDGALAVMTRTGGRDAERARLLVALADLMVVAGDLGRQIDYLERALALHETLGDEERAAQVHSRLGMAHSLIDSIYGEHLDIRAAFHHFVAARAVLGHGPPRKARGHLETAVATAMTYGVGTQEGIEAGARGMEIADQLGEDLLWAAAAQACGWHRIAAGELAEGLGLVERGFEVADREQRPFLAWMGSNIRGQLTWGLGAPDEAQPWFERLLRLPYAGNTAYRREIADGVGRCHASRGETEAARRLLSDARPAWVTHSLKPLLDVWEGRWDDAAALAAEILETSRRTGNRWDEWASYHLAGRVHHLGGDLEAANELLELALATVVHGGAPYFELWVRPDLARVLAERGRTADARVHADRCEEIAGNGEDWRGRAGHAALAGAVVLAAEDRTDEADAAFARAHATLERHRLRADEADALHQWGRALARAGDGAGAAERLERAAAIYAENGAGAAWLGRVDAERRLLAI